MNVDARELAWAAGLFEGEGCFCAVKDKRYRYPTWHCSASLAMTDRDSVERFARAVGVGAVTGPFDRRNNPGHWKLQYRWSVQHFEPIQHVAAVLWFGLGQRRREKAAEVVSIAATVGLKARWKTCKNGHAWTPENIQPISHGRGAPGEYGGRRCGECRRQTNREYMRRKRAAAKATA